MSKTWKTFYVTWSILYLIIMVIFIVGFDKITSWMDWFTGFVMGVTVWSLMIIYRDSKRGKRHLK